MNLIEYPDSDLMMMDVADTLAGDLNAALMTHDSVSFAVPGGTTPWPLFDTLAAVTLDWDRVRVFLTDERWVPETSERSNARLVRERLLTGKASAARFTPYYVHGEAPDTALARHGEALAAHLPLSVLLLGMGTDMHTASLFPGADRLSDALAPKAPPLMALSAEAVPEPRVTMTAPVLREAMATHLLVTGAEKRAALERAASLDDPAQAPVALVLRTAKVHWAP